MNTTRDPSADTLALSAACENFFGGETISNAMQSGNAPTPGPCCARIAAFSHSWADAAGDATSANPSAEATISNA
ncbi:MAG TPA: hypothetical protein VEW67_03240, partial [Thermoleophilaceae bacterium]|nr:hypothetical protein [Thermoleophilaceae bacterium]